MTDKQNVAETVARLTSDLRTMWTEVSKWQRIGPEAADRIEALSAQLAEEQAAVEQLRYIAGVNIQRAEAAEAERDELDFLLHEGGDDSVATLIAERDRLREERGAMVVAAYETALDRYRNAVLEEAATVAAQTLHKYAVEKGNTKTADGRTAIFYGRKVKDAIRTLAAAEAAKGGVG
jgi:hypothetical protein